MGDLVTGVRQALLLYLVIFLVAAIVTLVVCIVFMGTEPGRRSAVGRFIDFEKLHVDVVLKVLYVFDAVLLTLVSLYLVASLASLDLLFEGVLLGLFTFLAGQFVLRFAYEFIMVFVRMGFDVREIRNAVVGNRVLGSADAGSASPGSTLEFDARWDCVCGADGNKGEFCGFCGRPRP